MTVNVRTTVHMVSTAGIETEGCYYSLLSKSMSTTKLM